MLKLLNVDSPTERALKIVAYFDQLATNDPDLDAVIRATAVIADCPAGIELVEHGAMVRFNQEGAALDGRPSASAVSQKAEAGGGVAQVWLERGAEPRELDEFIAERFALTISGVLQRSQPLREIDHARGLSDPALAQLLVNGRATEAERSRAAVLLGLPPAAAIQLIAYEPVVAEDLDSLRHELQTAWKTAAFVAPLSRQLVLVVVVAAQTVSWDAAELAGRAASGPIAETLGAPESWHQARLALRFAGASVIWPHKLHSSDLGAALLLARLDTAEVNQHPDVMALKTLAETPSGSDDLRLLDHFLHADSLRSAARATNFHHSSLQSRIARIGSALGIDVHDPAGRSRAGTALALWQIHGAG
jgi:hypothetical protein